MEFPIKFTKYTPEELKGFQILYEKALELIMSDSIGKSLLQIAANGPHFKPDMSKDSVINMNLKIGQSGLVYHDETGDHCCLGPLGFRNTTSLNFDNPNNQDLTKINQIDITDQVTSSEKIGRLADIFFHELVHVRQNNRNKEFINDKTTQDYSLPIEITGSLVEADAYTQEILFSWRRNKNTDTIRYHFYLLKVHNNNSSMTSGFSQDEWNTFVYKIQQSQNLLEEQAAARYLFSSLLIPFYREAGGIKDPNIPLYNDEKALFALSKIYEPITYGCPKEFAACIPQLSNKNQKKLQKMISIDKYNFYQFQRE